MSDSDLPQPIYPPQGGGVPQPPAGGQGGAGAYAGSGSGASNSGGGFPPPGPPSAPPPGPPSGPPNDPYAGAGFPAPPVKPAGSNDWMKSPAVIAGAVAVLVVLLVVIGLQLKGDDDKSASGGNRGNGTQPGGGSTPPTQTSDPGSGGGGSGDLAARAQRAAAAFTQGGVYAPAGNDCLAAELSADEAALQVIESDNFATSDLDLAERLSTMVVGCLGVDGTAELFAGSLHSIGLGEADLQCALQDMYSWTQDQQWNNLHAVLLDPNAEIYRGCGY